MKTNRLLLLSTYLTIFFNPNNMKPILFLLFLCCNSFICWTQEDRSSYLFPEFVDSYIYYKDGRVLGTVQLRSSEKYVQIYRQSNEIKEFADPDMIVSIKVGERTFVLVDHNEAAEVVQADPRILVQYFGQKRIKKDLTFGGKTETASVDSYSNMIYGTGENEKNTVLTKIDYQFYIEKE